MINHPPALSGSRIRTLSDVLRAKVPYDYCSPAEKLISCDAKKHKMVRLMNNDGSVWGISCDDCSVSYDTQSIKSGRK